MRQGVTSLTFSNYDSANYTLGHDEGLKLSSMNKILLNLFNNDIYAFTMLVGRMKGVWWKYWFADDALKGYSMGDMVCSNGIQEIPFLGRYWNGVKQIADYKTVTNLLPDFISGDDEIVGKYLNALSDYFHLGNRNLERQIYVSLKDNNKDSVFVTTSWQPYLVTAEELQHREYYLNDILEDEVREHNSEYHAFLDILDMRDFDYEVNDEPLSIYNSELGKYLPKVKIETEESDAWVNFAASPLSNSTLGLGCIAFDFLHIVKPLGTDVHRLETWVRTDGHVEVKGYVPTAMLTELVPEPGTLEYNKWKMGGMRRYGFRLDYSMNDQVSKLYFTNTSENPVTDVSEIISGLPNMRSARMLDEEDDEDAASDSIYRIVTYRKDSSGVVVFYPKNCDFTFNEIASHPEVLKEGDVEILTDLLDGDKYTHTTEPIEQDEEMEYHSFAKKRHEDEKPKEPISPVDLADDLPTVSGTMRLLRDFGITRSPTFKTVNGIKVFPDANQLMMPSLINEPTAYVGNKSWITGQSIIFEVPNDTQNIQFEVNGMMTGDDFDFSLYDIHNVNTTDIQWVNDLVMRYECPKSIIVAACEEKFEDAESAKFLKNISGMMSRIEHCVLEYPTFATFMQLRAMDSTPLNGILTILCDKADKYLNGTGGTEDFRNSVGVLHHMYECLYMLIENKFRFGALYDCFKELVSGAVTIDQYRVVLLERIKEYLNNHQFTDEWMLQVKEDLKTANNLIAELVTQQKDEMAAQLSSVVKRVDEMLNEFIECKELTHRSFDGLPNVDTDSDEYKDELKRMQGKHLGNFKEIKEYLDEVQKALSTASDVRAQIRQYLSVDWLEESMKSYLTYQLAQLNDSMTRYKKLNLSICKGYTPYIEKWMELLGIVGTTQLETDYMVNDLFDNSTGKVSLKMIEQLLQREEEGE